MIVEIEEEDVQDFETIYNKDYIGKEAVRPIEYRPLPQYPPPLNILNGPYKEYLNTRLENQSLLIKDRSEDPEEYLKKVNILIIYASLLITYLHILLLSYIIILYHVYLKFRYATSFPI